MNQLRKRILAAALSVALMLPSIPVQIASAANEQPQSVEIQAENTQYTTVYKYSNIGATHVGGANESGKSLWPTYDQLASRNYFDKSNVPYIAFQVEAPADGSYSMAVAYQYGDAANMQHFATLIVNGGGSGNVYKTLRTDSGVRGGDATTQAVDVTLKKGINTVYCVVLTKDQLNNNTGWANVEKFVVDGRLTPVKHNALTLQATNATYLNKWNRADGYINNTNIDAARNEKISIADLSNTANLAKVPYASYTVYAQKDGYYDITVDVAAGTLQQDPDAVGLIVDGVAYAKPFAKHAGDGNNASRKTHFADLSVWLKAGTHTLTVTMLLPTNAAEAQSHTYCWTDISEITLRGGLVTSQIQVNPVTGEQSVEAAGSQYVLANRYSSQSTTDRNVFGYLALGGGNVSNNQTLADIRTNGLSTTDNAMATIFVFAPKDGTYSFSARGKVNIPGTWTTTPYFTFVANQGKDPYQSNFSGQNGWVSNTATVEVSLKQGINAVSCIPLVKDLITGSDCWVNLDCIFVDNELTVLSDMDFDGCNMTFVKAVTGANQVSKYATINRMSNLTQTSVNAYTDNAYIAGGVNAGGSYWPNTQTLGKYIDRSNASVIAYYVDAPEDGEYQIGMHLQMSMADGDLSDVFTTVIVNDGGADNSGIYTVPFCGENGKWANSFTKVQLRQGRNVIYIVLMNGAFSQSRSDWANFDCIMLDSRLTAVEAKDTIVNTGSSAYITGYKNIGTSVGGGIMPSTSVSIDALTNKQIDDAINSITFTVDAPKDGYYDIFLGFGFGDGVQNGAIAYLVDGVAQAREYSYMANSAANHGSGENYIDLGTYLTAGEHMITITCPLKRTADDPITLTDWCDLRNLHLTGGLTLAQTQRVPTEMKVVEAENSYWNRYGNTSAPDYIEAGAPATANSSASGGYVVGNAWQNQNQTFEEIKQNGLDSSNTAYIGYYVEAPADGEYEINARVYINAGSNWSAFRPYGVFVVNGTEVYKANYTGSNNAFNSTETLKVSLKKGINSIAFVARPNDTNLASSSGWANVDCLKIDSALIPVTDVTLKLAPSQATFYKYTANGDTLGGAQTGWAANAKLSADGVQPIMLSSIPSFSYTLTAEKDGYYDVVMKFSNASAEMDKLAFAVLVDDALTTTKLSRDLGQGGCNGELHVTVPMTAGDHVLSITMALPADADAAATINYSSLWTDIKDLHVIGGLQVAETQKDPTGAIDMSHLAIIEAEDSYWNRYGNTGAPDYIEAGADPVANVDASGGYMVGSAWQNQNQSFEEIKLNGLDSSNTAYIGYYVEAPADGEYELSSLVYINAGADWSVFRPYGVFVINGTDVYKAAYTGINNAFNHTESIKVALKKGINSIAFVPRPNDSNLASSSGWANVDCLKIDSALTPVTSDTLKLSPVESTYYMFTPSGSALVGANAKWAEKTKLSADAVTAAKLSGVPNFSYTLTAAKDGYYDILLKFSNTAQNTDKLAFAVLVDGQLTTAKISGDKGQSGCSGKLHLTLPLKAGDHVISITMALPKDAEAADAINYSALWTDMKDLYLLGGLAVAQTQKDPLTVLGADLAEPDLDPAHYVYVEAEDQEYTRWFNYAATEDKVSASGGKLVGGGNPAKNPTLEALLADPTMDLSLSSCFKIIVDAPIADEYAIMPRYMIRDKEQDISAELDPNPYVVMVVNGKIYTADNTSKNDWIANCEMTLVSLEKGQNEIFIIPLIKDLMDAGYDYANYDCTILEGRLTPVKHPVLKAVEAEDKTLWEWNKYSGKSANPNASGGYYVENAFNATHVDFSDLKEGVDLSKTGYIKIKVTAPADGEYPFRARYAFRTKAQDPSTEFTGDKPYVAFFVNGTAYKAENLSKNDWIADTAEIKIKLKAGENTIYVIPLTADQEAKFAPKGQDCWANVDCVYMDSTLIPSKTDYIAPPDNTGRTRVEAEDIIYTEQNSYHSTEQNKGYSNGLVAAGSHAGNNVYLKDLEPGVDLVNTAYLKWTFVAPKAGNYNFAVRLNQKSYKLAADELLKPEGYATLWVNDSKVYKAPLAHSEAKNAVVTETLDVSVWLEAGENSIVLIPLIKDLYDAYGNGWSNVDCLYYDPALTVKKAPIYTRIDAINSDYFGYIPEGGLLMHEDYGSSFTNNMTFENLTIENVNNISWVKYTVQAEADGVYRVGVGFIEGGTLPSGKVYIAMSVNGDAFTKVNFNHTENLRRQQLIYMDVPLHEGENTILVTACLAEYFTDKGVAQLYIDHSHLMLPEGVYGFIMDTTPSWTGDDLTNIGDSLTFVWGDTSGKAPEETPVTPTEPSVDDSGNAPDLTWLWILIALAVIGGGTVIYLAAKKKKKAN